MRERVSRCLFRQFGARRALTLLETIIVLSVVLVVVSLAAMGVRSARESADRAVATQRLRQIGIALHAHAKDHDGSLPGPMWPGQIPILDPNRAGRLANHLASYLGEEMPAAPRLSSFWVPPAFARKAAAGVMEQPRTFVLNMAVSTPEGTPVNPWGSLVSGEGKPLKLFSVPPTAWAMSDADQQHPRVAAAPWRQFTPAEPVHGARRLALTYGGGVVRVTDDELEAD